MEQVEYLVTISLWDPRPLVRQADQRLRAIALHLQLDRRAGGRVFRRVLDDVRESLADQHGIDVKHRQIERHIDDDVPPNQQPGQIGPDPTDDFA